MEVNMPTVFESISDGFYTAFFEPDPKKREEKIEAWIKESIPVIQSAVESDLRAYLEGILGDTWTETQWKARAEKYYGRSVRIGKRDELPFIDAYKLSLDVKIRQRALRTDIVTDTLTPEVRAKTNEAIGFVKKVLSELKTAQSLEVKTASSIRTANDDDDADEYEDEERSPNDDRSDSMNPNNDSYQASMDNRSDQMNPNNDAYWSSRGR
jgi:hypothetical protein